MHVEDITVGWGFSSDTNRHPFFRVRVFDELDNPVYGATVTGKWSGCFKQSGVSAVTGDIDFNGNGTIEANETGWATALSTRGANCHNRQCTFVFTVTNVTRSGDSYDPSQNVETTDSTTCNPFLP